MDPHLSENFRRSEFECRCCGEMVISPVLVDTLQDLREKLGVPVRIMSGYRCAPHNHHVGGSPSSRHLAGIAADIYYRHIHEWRDTVALLSTLQRFKDGGIGVYPGRGIVHVDVRDGAGRWGFIRSEMVPMEKALRHAEQMKG